MVLCYGIPWKELIRWFTRPTRSLPGEEKEGRVIPLQGTNCTKAWQGDIESSVSLKCSLGGGNGRLHMRSCMCAHMVCTHMDVVVCIGIVSVFTYVLYGVLHVSSNFVVCVFSHTLVQSVCLLCVSVPVCGWSAGLH